jgi:hypothetical protein
VVQSQPRQIVHETLSQKNPSHKRAAGVAQDVGPEFKPQYCKKKKKCRLGIESSLADSDLIGCHNIDIFCVIFPPQLDYKLFKGRLIIVLYFLSCTMLDTYYEPLTSIQCLYLTKVCLHRGSTAYD